MSMYRYNLLRTKSHRPISHQTLYSPAFPTVFYIFAIQRKKGPMKQVCFANANTLDNSDMRCFIRSCAKIITG